MNGHLVIHANMVPRAPAETNQLGIIKKMLEAILEILVKEPGVLGVEEVIKALKNRNMPVDEAQILWLLQESPQHNVFSFGSNGEVEALLVPRDEWLDHVSPGVHVSCGRPQEDGGSGHYWYLTFGAGVASDLSQEEGQLSYRCQGPNRGKKNQGRRYLDLTPVVFYADDGEGHIRNAGRQPNEVSVLSDLNEGRERGGLEIQPFGSCWIETVMRRKYMEVTRDMTRELKKRKDALVRSGGVWTQKAFDEDVQELFRYKDDGTVEVHRCINDVQWNAFRGLATVCRDGELGKEDVPAWTRNASDLAARDGRRRSKQHVHEEQYVEKHVCSEAVSEEESRGAISHIRM